jgi:hypothetical protein
LGLAALDMRHKATVEKRKPKNYPAGSDWARYRHRRHVNARPVPYANEAPFRWRLDDVGHYRTENLGPGGALW